MPSSVRVVRQLRHSDHEAYERFTSETRPSIGYLVGPWYHIPWTQQVGASGFRRRGAQFCGRIPVGLARSLDERTTQSTRCAPAREGVRDRKQQLARRGPLAVAWDDNANLVSAERWSCQLAQRQRLSEPRKTRRDRTRRIIFCTTRPALCRASAVIPVVTRKRRRWDRWIQRDVELRNDVLVYSSPPLDRSLWVAGKVTVGSSLRPRRATRTGSSSYAMSRPMVDRLISRKV